MSRSALGLGFVGGCVALTAGSLFLSLQRTYSLQRWSDAAFYSLIACQCLALVLGAVSFARVRKTPSGSGVGGRRVRLVFCFLVLGVLGYLSCFQPFKAMYLLFYAGILAGIVAFVLTFFVRGTPSRGWGRIEVVLFNLCVLILGLEIGLRALAMVSKSPLLARTNSVEDTIRRYRFEPGKLVFGARCNSDGFNDEEWDEEWEGVRVALIGDSFVVGVVPQSLHFSSIAEGHLLDVRIECRGINGAGPGEYAILAEEATRRGVDLVVMSFFVGNDFEDSLRFQPTLPWLRSWLDVENVLVFSVWNRLRVLLNERKGGGLAGVGSVQGQDLERKSSGDSADLERDYPWIADVALEKGTFSEQAFLEVEKHRLVGTCSPQGVIGYESAALAMQEVIRACGDTPIVAVIIPDEFQIEDQLWNDLVESIHGESGSSWDREQPQKRLAELLNGLGIESCDLLEPLRAVEPMSDGMRHVYHLRDTHLNTRGNEVAGRVLAQFLSKHLDLKSQSQ